MANVGDGDRQGSGQASATLQLLSLSTALAAIRRRLAQGSAPEHDALDGLAASLRSLPSAGGRDSAAADATTAVMDEIAGLVGQLEIERDALGQRIRAWRQHRRAQSSYGAGRPPR